MPSNKITSFRWELVDFIQQHRDARNNGGLTSKLFSLSTRRSIKFELFVRYGGEVFSQGDVRVILKQSNGKPVEASVKLWIEHTNGQKFGETYVEKHMFSKINDFCGYNGIVGNGWNYFWDLYENHDTFFICCELTDLNGYVVSIENYQEFLQNHLAFYEQELHNAVITVDKTEFKIFKLMFMTQSEVFKSMFSSNFKEGITSKVEIKDIDEDTMKHFVKWFYTGQIEDECPVEKLFTAADKYDVKVLKKICAENMILTLDEDNAFDRLVLALMHNDDQFKEDILDFISGLPSNAFTNFLASDDWLDFVKRNEAVSREVSKLIRDKMNS